MFASFCLGILVSILDVASLLTFVSAERKTPIRIEKRTNPEIGDNFWLKTQWVASHWESVTLTLLVAMIYGNFYWLVIGPHPMAHTLGFLPMVAIFNVARWMATKGSAIAGWGLVGVFFVALGTSVVSLYLIGLLLYETIWGLAGYLFAACLTANECYRSISGLAGMGLGAWIMADMPIPLRPLPTWLKRWIMTRPGTSAFIGGLGMALIELAITQVAGNGFAAWTMRIAFIVYPVSQIFPEFLRR